jgi:tetratricopeptide (TPR) repeat protein
MTSPLLSYEDSFLLAIERKIAAHTRLNALFGLALTTEILGLLLFFPFFIQSALFAFMIALLTLTLFGYLMYRQYSRSEKEEWFEKLLDQFLNQQREENGYTKGDPASHQKISKMCARLSDKLYQKEYRCFKTPKRFPQLGRIIETASCWLFWKDFLVIRELLLKKAVEEHLELVRAHPANLESHTLLANAYVMLSGLYAPPEDESRDRWIPFERYGEESAAKFRSAAESAIEEFKIMKEYAPKDPWIYSQLAFSYKDLKMPDEERASYEHLLDLQPNDHETRFKLGALYFKRGENAKGLKVYGELKKAQFLKAEELLTIYGRM